MKLMRPNQVNRSQRQFRRPMLSASGALGRGLCILLMVIALAQTAWQSDSKSDRMDMQVVIG